MNLSDFEQQLRRQPMRSIPAEWRPGILEAASEATRERLTQQRPDRASWWREQLCPRSLAWGGLACAVWLGCLIAAAVFMPRSSHENAGASVAASPTDSMNVIAAAIQERREMLGLAEPAKAPVVTPKPKSPGPSSERRPALFGA